ncbi:hypothetical protein [Spiroplasma tabanidicola]|uniref:Uncharacterized protein n=1 Tax=Spiroplasma tabanidicola TaxID=324079 RepID=A0A6I6CCZ4_9MOLU|nr:hypothetical protein [Spiroplasma tabanidicola]QGS51844.1 hypothetical protein STABA_v1c04810 [Spiroplasma tabanidicola]
MSQYKELNSNNKNKSLVTLLMIFSILFLLCGIALILVSIISGKIFTKIFNRNGNATIPNWYYYLIFDIGFFNIIFNLIFILYIRNGLNNSKYSLYQQKIYLLANLLIFIIAVFPIFIVSIYLKYIDLLKKESLEDEEKFDKYINSNAIPKNKNKKIMLYLFIFLIILVNFLLIMFLNSDYKESKVEEKRLILALNFIVFIFFCIILLISPKLLCDTNIYLNENKQIKKKWLIIGMIPIIGSFILLIYFYNKKDKKLHNS